MKWVTRARPKVDRVACPWLIKRFVDPQAEFLYAPPEEVVEVAQREGAIPFDVPNVELGHHGSECSFDAIIKKYELTDRACATCGYRQRGRHSSKRTGAGIRGLEAIAEGFRLIYRNDHELWSESRPSTMRSMGIAKTLKKGNRGHDIQTRTTFL